MNMKKWFRVLPLCAALLPLAAHAESFDFSWLKKGAISESCYHTPCSMAKVVSFENQGDFGGGVSLELELLDGERHSGRDPIQWNAKPHKVHVYCSKTKPTVTMHGDVTHLPLAPQRYPGALMAHGELYMRACHSYEGPVEDGAARFGYDLEDE